MICLPNQLPLLKYGDHDVVHYESRWLRDSIHAAATKAGHDDWWFAADIARAVIEYLRERFPSATITIEQLYEKIARVLNYLGWKDIASQLEANPPPLQISLVEIAELAGEGYELEFFRILRRRLNDVAHTGSRQIHVLGVRRAVKQLRAAKRWNPSCDALCEDIVNFVRRQVLRSESASGIGLVVK
jgi:hypothetical protein